MLEEEKRQTTEADKIMTFAEYVAEYFPELNFSDDELPADGSFEEPDLDFLNSLPEPEFPEDFSGMSFEVRALMSFSIDELKAIEKALIKDSSELGNAYLASQIRETIDHYPF